MTLRQGQAVGSPITVSMHNPTAVYREEENEDLKNSETDSLTLTLYTFHDERKQVVTSATLSVQICIYNQLRQYSCLASCGKCCSKIVSKSLSLNQSYQGQSRSHLQPFCMLNFFTLAFLCQLKTMYYARVLSGAKTRALQGIRVL